VTNKRENDPGKAAASVLLQELSGVYKTAADLKFREDRGIYVLDKNKSATVLLQCGYINNRMDLEFITKRENQEKLARSILRGIVAYNKKLAFQPAPSLFPDDSLPKKYTIKSIDMKFSKGFVLKGENINMFVPEGDFDQNEIEFIEFNLEQMTVEEAKKKLNGVVIKSANVTLVPPNDKAAIEKYGQRAKAGMLIITDAVIEKKNILTEKLLKNPETDPLIIVDGKELPRTPLSDGQTSQLSTLDPNTIESINILKGESAIALYGEKGKNGVVVITLRKQPGVPTEKKDSLSGELTMTINTVL
jgi:TonB-dependent SusC/RagA subfamily outer membrane receptor